MQVAQVIVCEVRPRDSPALAQACILNLLAVMSGHSYPKASSTRGSTGDRRGLARSRATTRARPQDDQTDCRGRHRAGRSRRRCRILRIQRAHDEPRAWSKTVTETRRKKSMPFVNVKLVEGVFSTDEKHALAKA